MKTIPPLDTPAPRIESLAALPVFLKLDGRRAVVAGDGEAAAWKAELLAAAGARVEVFAANPSGEILHLAGAGSRGSITVSRRSWEDRDLDGAAMAVGALEGEDAAAFAAAARRKGVPVNIVDTPDLSTFGFGAIVARGPVAIGIGTDGVAPVLGQAIRAKIEALLPAALGAWAEAARRARAAVKARFPIGPARREAWRRFAEAALSARRAPMEGEVENLLLAAPATGGSVALVGAGPGDPELLTLKALRALQSADAVLHDRLVSPEILALARREARRVLVGKTGGGPHCKQADINALMARLALEGRRVVRLKGGDPMIFGRAAEEIAACRAAGVPVEVIPGVTAALGAAAELQIPLTDRRYSRRLEFVTGHAEDGRAPDHDWSSLADPWATTVFYMGSRTFRAMLPKLLGAGLDPETPALAIAAATTPQRSAVRRPVSELAAGMMDLDDGAPRLIIVGRVVAAMTGEIPPPREAAAPEEG